jgi:hypothetical protein
MAQAQLFNGCWTLKSVACHHIALNDLLAAASDLLDNDASLLVHDT